MIGRWALAALACLGLLAGALGAAWGWERTHPLEHQVRFSIARGTVIRQANGSGTLIPRDITLTIGRLDTLVIRNDDQWPARVGPFLIAPGQTYRQRFRAPGVVSMLCATMYHSENVRVTVLPGASDPWSLIRALARG